MNALPEMLHFLKMASNGTDMSVLQSQRAQMNWQQQQSYINGNDQLNMFSIQDAEVVQFQPGDSAFGRFMNRAVKPDPGMETEWPDYGKIDGDNHLGYGSCEYGHVNGIEMNYAISRTTSCTPAVVATAIEKGASSDTNGKEQILPEKSCTMGRESFKKRKADNTDNQKVTEKESIKYKKIRGSAEETDLKIKTYQNSNKSSTKQNNSDNKETSNDTSKEKSKISEVQKPDYIHVRARRGQATDSHSLAERVRREKISERMKYLQDLVPGCNKITGKAGMLDEIINYVQSLQRQVEFLSMKLATVNPRLDLNIDNLFRKEMIPACTSNFPTIGLPSEMANPAYSQFNPLQQPVTCCGIDLEINPLDMALKRSTSAPVPIAETFVNSSYFNQMQHLSNWDAELQNLYNVEFQQGRSTAYPPQLFSDSEGNNLKMEM